MRLPLKPALPRLLVPLAACWVSVLLVVELQYRSLSLSPALPLVGALVFALLCLNRLRRTGRLSLVLLTPVVVCLSLCSASCFYGQLSQQASTLTASSETRELILIEDTRVYPSSCGSEALLLSEDGSQIRVRVFWNNRELQLPKGSRVEALCSLSPLQESQRWLYEKGIAGTFTLSAIEVKGFSNDVWGAIDWYRHQNVERITELGGDGAALLAGVLLGNRELLQDTEVEQDFVTCGLTHLIAVSGSHLAVVAALLCWLLKRLPLRKSMEVIILLSVLALYVMLTGLQPSAIRSAIMAGIAGCSVFVGRRGHAPSALTGAAIFMLLWYPPHAFSLGFWLSVSAVLGLTVFSNLVACWIAQAAPLKTGENPGLLSSALALTLTANAATLPLTIATFAVVSLVSPLANLFAAPLVSMILVIGMVALLLPPILASLSAMLLELAALIAGLCTELASLLSQVPGASTPLEAPFLAAASTGVVAAILIYFSWPLPKPSVIRAGTALVVVVALGAALLSPSFSIPRLVVMDVGQGDAILIQEQGTTILIDTGESEAALVHALARNRVRHIDALIITHLDSDHVGAMGRLRGLLEVERVYFAQGLLAHQGENQYIQTAYRLAGRDNVHETTQGMKLKLGEKLSLYTIWPEEEAREGSNEESVCLMLYYDENGDGLSEQQVLLTGDAEQNELSQMLTTYPSLVAGIIKVGHHGSKDAVQKDQLEQLFAKVALISVGAENRYGHPSFETLEVLESSGLQILRTDEQGDITCFFRSGSAELRCATMKNEPY